MIPIQTIPCGNPEGKIVALGELLVDFVPCEMGMRLADPGAVLKTASGSSGIVACAAANLGAEAGFIGKLGRDSLSRLVRRIMEEQGVDLSRVAVADEGQIGLAFIEYTPAGRNYQYYRRNSAGSRLTPAELDPDYIGSAFCIHYPGMLLELTPEMAASCQRAVEAARAGGAIVSFDPNIRKELMQNAGAPERLAEAVRTADVIAPTLDEARFITGRQEPDEILRALHAMGPRLIALTRDKDGAILSCGGEVVWADGIDVDALDPTGAGDTFAAALCYSLQQGYSLERIAGFCNCAGTLVTMKRGAIGMALPTRGEVLELMESGACRLHVERERPAS